MSCFIVRKERTNRNTILHLQISHVVLYHWGLTTKKVTCGEFGDRSKRLDERIRFLTYLDYSIERQGKQWGNRYLHKKY